MYSVKCFSDENGKNLNWSLASERLEILPGSVHLILLGSFKKNKSVTYSSQVRKLHWNFHVTLLNQFHSRDIDVKTILTSFKGEIKWSHP